MKYHYLEHESFRDILKVREDLKGSYLKAEKNLTEKKEKLYRANFSSEHSRQQAYLAVHATLFKNKQTPRIYVPDKPLD